MQLWSEYEGRTVAETYPLSKLLRPEGRSAFFSTSNGTGTPSVIRIIETHFDESEILNRWKAVSELGQPNLITMRKYGETVLDGTPLVYAVMEPTEADLSEVLQNRTLTVEETRELATSLIDAVRTLHSHGFVHEHIQPENIYAAGETVKLRSDCIREAASGLDDNSPEIEARKTCDVHALAVVLLQALTGHRELRGSATLLPPPFDAIIRNGLSGNWGMDKMAAALVSPRSAAANSATETAARPAEKTPTQSPQPAGPPTRFTPAAPSQSSPTPAAKPTPQPSIPAITPSTARSAAVPQSPAPVEQPRPITPIAPQLPHRIVKPIETDPRRMRKWIAAGAGALLLLLLLWYFTRSHSNTDPRPISTLATPAAEEKAPSVPPPHVTPSDTKPSAAITPASPSTTGHKLWRVIAYTYNREEQAKEKAQSVASHDPGLSPEVFTPTGKAPYLVSLGGPMSYDDATAFRKKAIAAGLPHDTYIQNYTH